MEFFSAIEEARQPLKAPPPRPAGPPTPPPRSPAPATVAAPVEQDWLDVEMDVDTLHEVKALPSDSPVQGCETSSRGNETEETLSYLFGVDFN